MHIFHLTKIAGDKEVRELFRQSDLQFEDLWMPTKWPAPLKPIQIPYLFFFLDTERTFEIGLTLLYEEKLVRFTGELFDSTDLDNNEAQIIVQNSLLVTVGDQLKVLTLDQKGNIIHKSKEELKT